jgi:short-subunit dehydrogenase
MKRYDATVAVVTGASSGIGRRIAVDLTARGATVIGLARREALLKDLRDELQRVSPQSDTIVCDVSDVPRFRADLTEVEHRFGRIDILINDAGIHEATPATREDAFAAHQRIMATNYFAAVASTLAVVPGMLTRGSGIVVNVSSDSARAPEIGESAYAASKSALAVFSESVAYELAPRGVNVHVLFPAWVPTAMGTGDDGNLPPRLIRRTEGQVSRLVLDRMGGSRIDINASRLPLLAVLARTLAPRLYARGMRTYGSRP